jgi:hypothetical protein
MLGSWDGVTWCAPWRWTGGSAPRHRWSPAHHWPIPVDQDVRGTNSILERNRAQRQLEEVTQELMLVLWLVEFSGLDLMAFNQQSIRILLVYMRICIIDLD